MSALQVTPMISSIEEEDCLFAGLASNVDDAGNIEGCPEEVRFNPFLQQRIEHVAAFTKSSIARDLDASGKLRRSLRQRIDDGCDGMVAQLDDLDHALRQYPKTLKELDARKRASHHRRMVLAQAEREMLEIQRLSVLSAESGTEDGEVIVEAAAAEEEIKHENKNEKKDRHRRRRRHHQNNDNSSSTSDAKAAAAGGDTTSLSLLGGDNSLIHASESIGA